MEKTWRKHGVASELCRSYNVGGLWMDWIEMKDRSKVWQRKVIPTGFCVLVRYLFLPKGCPYGTKSISYPTRFYFFITFNFMNFQTVSGCFH
jgi:hypothetical protein